jgi:hypothetical protein
MASALRSAVVLSAGTLRETLATWTADGEPGRVRTEQDEDHSTIQM